MPMDNDGASTVSRGWRQFAGESDGEYLRRLLLVRLVYRSVSLNAAIVSAQITKVMERMGLRPTTLNALA